MIYDVAIAGTGPAGVSAALTLKAREKSFVWIGSRNLSDKVEKAERILNYPGLGNVTGEGLNEAFKKQILDLDIDIEPHMVNSIMSMGDHFALMAGENFYEAKTVILATGVSFKAAIPGEDRLLGSGLSYCATCDGRLYKGKTIAVVCNNPRFEDEVKFLSDLAGNVHFFAQYKTEGSALAEMENVIFHKDRIKEINGEMRVEKITTDEGELPVDGIFILRDSISLSALLPGLETENGHIKVNRDMSTNIPGVFAAGDCTGRPYQYAKAVGEGNVAAHSVVEYLG